MQFSTQEVMYLDHEQMQEEGEDSRIVYIAAISPCDGNRSVQGGVTGNQTEREDHLRKHKIKLSLENGHKTRIVKLPSEALIKVTQNQALHINDFRFRIVAIRENIGRYIEQ